MFGVGCWFLLLVGVFLLWFFLSCCVSFLASAPYAPSYISYDVSSHSEWALDFLLGCSTTGVAFFDSLVAKDCQYPRDPMQPAIKKKNQSKSVTSCAGMTAHFVLLAQTKVGFLSGGRSRRMKELPEKEVLAQLEEAYARATVALTRAQKLFFLLYAAWVRSRAERPSVQLTRAQKLCIIMGPLDMRGLLGAATVIGCLKYGAGVCGVHVSNPAAEVFLKDGSLNGGPDDEAFLLSLRRSLKTARGAYPPVALAEIYQEYKSPLTKIRRLHLMVVDLGRSRSVSPQVY